ncbi:hypothetical protein EXIGLDRAFT_171350 [Exidia glandulosa HHB12029]|uniref:Uncharacterized protein n=1 Tax=Exidia glandulosa HHB12029 TaxID=1314781 RepID=A0A165FB71_EXIGL|nr:hypothetical protein EXIGLDRAFT_171350 [Exidia glandulosa HHB12029]
MRRDSDYVRYMMLHRPETKGCIWCQTAILGSLEVTVSLSSHDVVGPGATSDLVGIARSRMSTPPGGSSTGTSGCKKFRPYYIPRSIACNGCRTAYDESEAGFQTGPWYMHDDGRWRVQDRRHYRRIKRG